MVAVADASNILITGGGGQDGLILSKLHESAGNKVFAIVKAIPQFPVAGTTYVTEESLLDDKKKLGELVFDVKPSIVYHLASAHGPSGTMTEANLGEQLKAAGINGTANVCENILSLSPKTKVIVALSSRMYSKNLESAINENTEPSPSDFYGEVKVKMWEIVSKFRDAEGLNAGCSILFNHDSISKKRGYLSWDIASQIDRIIAGESETIRLRQPNVMGDFSHASDICAAMALQARTENLQDYVLGAGFSMSINHIVSEVSDLLRISPLTIEDASEKKTQLPYSDTTKAETELNWHRKSSFARAITEMVGVLQAAR